MIIETKTSKEVIAEMASLKYLGFKLILLELKGFSFFGDIKYDFIDDNDNTEKLYTTVVIGPNGTRKSLLFRLIIDIFNLLEKHKNVINANLAGLTKGDFHLKYALNNFFYEVKRVHNEKTNKPEFFYFRNNEPYEIKDFDFPYTITGSSTSISDKYPFYKTKEFSRFQYLGVKNSPQSASTRSYIRKTIDFIAKTSFHGSFLNCLNLISKTFLGEDKQFCISYRTANTKLFFDGNLHVEVLDKHFNEIETRFKELQRQPPFKLTNYKTAKSNNLIFDAINLSKELVNKNHLQYIYNSSAKRIFYNISDVNDFERLKKENEALNTLYSIGLLVNPQIEIIYKNGEKYSLEDSSSGEMNLITSLIGMIASFKQNSLLFIDEPEISLHPNWQMRYISLIKELFSNEIFNSSHIVIATHSHFLVSDLEGKSSKIIGLTNNNGLKTVEFGDKLNTFGWSAEDVLYRVFGVKSSRNFYFEMAIADLLDLLYRKSKDINKISAILNDLKNLDISENDPLNELIKETDNYLHIC